MGGWLGDGEQHVQAWKALFQAHVTGTGEHRSMPERRSMERMCATHVWDGIATVKLSLVFP